MSDLDESNRAIDNVKLGVIFKMNATTNRNYNPTVNRSILRLFKQNHLSIISASVNLFLTFNSFWRFRRHVLNS